MKRLLLAILRLAVAAPVPAQTEPPGEGPHPAMGAARHAIANFLDLDPDQVAAWDLLWADHRSAEQPLRRQIADVQAAIDDLFAAGVPDPAELGLLVIERHDLGEALVDVHVIYVEGFHGLLDDEQMRRLDQIRLADRIQPWIPAFKAFELVRR
ncbi:MAG TPA: hypothetical protein VLT32_19755 [Candidatus Sulfomarinibacteraceae bacterium]|nr:hypothetical protein [Candidatus Sulfomarinibacteraceae bacterium]